MALLKPSVRRPASTRTSVGWDKGGCDGDFFGSLMRMFKSRSRLLPFFAVKFANFVEFSFEGLGRVRFIHLCIIDIALDLGVLL